MLYHRSLRSKRYESELKSVAGVGAATVKKVLEVFNTRSIVCASADEIAAKAGITKKTARSIYSYYHPETEDTKLTTLKYKLVASDMDGTLLNDKLEISPRNLAAIQKYRAAGGIFTLATGRSAEGVAPYAKALGLDEHPVKLVCNIGCATVDSVTLAAEETV